MSNQHSKCDDCYKSHLPEVHDMTILPSEAFGEGYVPEFNQASEKELQPFTSLFQNSAVARDYISGCMSEEDINELSAHIFFIEPTYKYDISKEPIDNVFSAYRIAIKDLIRTEKLKLLAEVRERVVGSLEPQTENGLLPDRVDRRNQLRTEQLEELTKLEAELDRIDKGIERCNDGCWVTIDEERNKLKERDDER